MQGGGGGHFFRLTCSVMLWGGRNTANKYHWNVWECLQCLCHTGLAPAHWHVCFPILHCSGSRLLCRELSGTGMTRYLVSTVAGSWGLPLIASLVPAPRFSDCITSTPSQVCRVSLLGSWSLAATLPEDVDHPESQEVLVSNKACLQFGRWCLSGAVIALFWLWLPPPAYLWLGMGWSAVG